MKARSKKGSRDSRRSRQHSAGRRGFLLGSLAAAAAALLPRWVMAQIPSWHRPDGSFANNYIAPINKSFSDLRKAFEPEKPPHISFPLAENDPEALRANRTDRTVTWVGHCTFLLQAGGLNVLTDPQFSDRASPLPFAGPRRGTPPGLEIDELPPIDLILISHNHYDHLDSASIRQLAKHSPQARVVTPLKLAGWFGGYGFAEVTEHDWWESFEFKGVRLTATPSQHWSMRNMFNRNRTLWCGWALEFDGFSFLFIGDSGYTKDFSDIRERLGEFDLAVIPIGAYNPRWFMKDAHQNPEEAVQCLLDLGAKRGLASHWGTFDLTLEPFDEPPQRLVTALAQQGLGLEDFWVLQHGETRRIDDG